MKITSKCCQYYITAQYEAWNQKKFYEACMTRPMECEKAMQISTNSSKIPTVLREEWQVWGKLSTVRRAIP